VQIRKGLITGFIAIVYFTLAQIFSPSMKDSVCKMKLDVINGISGWAMFGVPFLMTLWTWIKFHYSRHFISDGDRSTFLSLHYTRMLI
jgi:hypothetical protein